MYKKVNIPEFRRHDLELDGVERLWIELKVEKCRFNSDRAISSDSGVFITSDRNENLCHSQRLVQPIKHVNLSQLIDQPTYFSETSPSLFDIF